MHKRLPVLPQLPMGLRCPIPERRVALVFSDLAAILKESQRLKKENRSLLAFVRERAKGCGPGSGAARELLAKLSKAKKVKT